MYRLPEKFLKQKIFLRKCEANRYFHPDNNF